MAVQEIVVKTFCSNVNNTVVSPFLSLYMLSLADHLISSLGQRANKKIPLMVELCSQYPSNIILFNKCDAPQSLTVSHTASKSQDFPSLSLSFLTSP